MPGAGIHAPDTGDHLFNEPDAGIHTPDTGCDIVGRMHAYTGCR